MERAHFLKFGWGLTIASAVLLVSSSTALAADGGMVGGEEIEEDVDEEDEEVYDKMLDLSAEGNELYEAGQFAEAADVYARAYEAYPQAILLKNQMITRYLIEECETAIELGEKFIESGEASDQDQEDVEAVFAECSLDLAEEAVADEDWAGAEEWLDFGEPHLFEDQLRAESEELRDEVDAEIGGDREVDEIDDPGMSTRELAGWSVGGAGLAALVGATVWHISWERRNSQFQQMDEGTEAYEQEEEAIADSYQTVRWAIPTLYGVGTTAVLTGAGLLLWPMIAGDENAQALQIQPRFGAGEAGAVMSIRF